MRSRRFLTTDQKVLGSTPNGCAISPKHLRRFTLPPPSPLIPPLIPSFPLATCQIPPRIEPVSAYLNWRNDHRAREAAKKILSDPTFVMMLNAIQEVSPCKSPADPGANDIAIIRAYGEEVGWQACIEVLMSLADPLPEMKDPPKADYSHDPTATDDDDPDSPTSGRSN